ncbi:YncE family protein [Virgibacillus halodenitrificans]|uniref:YncE family protein n=1 Tax=Virgibacillus halodenitrificans TaxID=1482 RepID=UPI00076133CF
MWKKIILLCLFILLPFTMLVACTGNEEEDLNKPAEDKPKEKTTSTDDEPGAEVYVNNRDAGNIQVIDSSTNEVLDTIRVGEKPTYNEIGQRGNMFM